MISRVLCQNRAGKWRRVSYSLLGDRDGQHDNIELEAAGDQGVLSLLSRHVLVLLGTKSIGNGENEEEVGSECDKGGFSEEHGGMSVLFVCEVSCGRCGSVRRR
jgi:hypothetical protein